MKKLYFKNIKLNISNRMKMQEDCNICHQSVTCERVKYALHIRHFIFPLFRQFNSLCPKSPKKKLTDRKSSGHLSMQMDTLLDVYHTFKQEKQCSGDMGWEQPPRHSGLQAACSSPAELR